MNSVDPDAGVARAGILNPGRSARGPEAAIALRRLRWRCRRGMLENDLILTRFLDLRGAVISDDEVVALDRLLDLADNDLWDLLSGQKEPDDATVRPLLGELRTV